MSGPKKENMKEPVRPGDILYHLCVVQNITQEKICRETGINNATITHIIKGKRRITPKVAVGLANFFKNDKYYWIGLQNEYDFWELEREKDDSQTK